MHRTSRIRSIRFDRRLTPSQRHAPVSICVDRIPAFRKLDRHHMYRRVSHCNRIEKAFMDYGRGAGVGRGDDGVGGGVR